MITEDYVSFETAKLLKEKGFNEPIWTRYENDDDNEVIFGDKYNWNNSPMGQISAPTLQMAMKWLREVHNIFIDIEFGVGGCYVWAIVDMSDNIVTNVDALMGFYEQACESAIKYCLENLI